MGEGGEKAGDGGVPAPKTGRRNWKVLEAEQAHAFLRHLAVVEQVASSTQNQAA